VWLQVRGGKEGGKDRERVDKKGQKEKLGYRTMDCSTGEEGKLMGERIRIRR
jgi:hypothetical protein